MKANTKETKNVSILDQMLEDASINQISKKTLTESEAITLVDKHYNEVLSKNAMLKLIRGLGYSISMSRLFNIYISYTNLKNKIEKDTK